MINYKKLLVGFLFIMVLGLLTTSISTPVQAKNNKVLVIHSYHQEMDWVGQGLNSGIKKALKGTNTKIEFMYMDTKRNTSQTWMKKQTKKALTKIKSSNPDVVILTDDNAQKYVGKKLVNTDINIVFCGVNGTAKDYNYPGNNITGILERPHAVESIQLLRNNLSGINKVTFITDEGSTGDSVVKYVKKISSQLKNVKINYIQESNFTNWKEKIKKLNKTTDAAMFYTYHNQKDAQGNHIGPKKVGTWTMNNIEIPSIGLFDWNINHGALLGIIESGQEHGLKAGKRAKNIINGAKPTSMPITKATEGKILINTKTIERLNLDISYDIIDLADEIIQ